jgi:hypothetical protein
MKLYHKLLSALVIPVCLFAILYYGISFLSVLTERGGLNGSIYIYYGLTEGQWVSYTFLVSAVAFALIVLQVRYLLKRDAAKLTKTFWVFVFYVVVVFLCEWYLSTHFIGKG